MPGHSIERAMEIQEQFEKTVLKQTKGVLGVGIGLNKGESDFALNVQVATVKDIETIPKQFDGLDIVVDVVGANTAL